MTRERSHTSKKEVKECDIRSFPGMNVSDAVSYLLPRLRALQETREIDPDDLMEFLKSMHGVYPIESPHHIGWWSKIQSEIICPLEKAYEQAKLEKGMGPCEIEEHFFVETEKGGPDTGLDFRSILDRLEAELSNGPQPQPLASSQLSK